MNKHEKRPVNLSNNDDSYLLENFCASCSSGECTGLIPAGENLTEDELESYKSLYPFSTPLMLDEY